MVKNLPAMRKTQVQSLGQENPLEKGMSTHSSILAWRIPWTVSSFGLFALYLTLWTVALPGSSVHGDSTGKNVGVSCHAFLQGIFPTQGSKPGLLHCRQILYQLSHKGSPRVLEWVAYPFSSRSSWPRNGTGISCITDGFFTNWAMREAPS